MSAAYRTLTTAMTPFAPFAGGLAFVAALAVGCDKASEAEKPVPGRSEVIAAAQGMPTTVAAPSAAPAAAKHAAPAAPRELCVGELDKPGRKLPKGTFTPVATSGAEPPKAEVVSGAKKWTWINFFAAWCGPCKEEMPRLKAFQQKLAENLEISFVSLDDDERQLKQFLAAQPPAGVRAALWLEEKPRDAWLGALNMKRPPDLPAHVLVDPSGKVRCVMGGAVEDADFPAVAKLVAQP